MTSPDVGWPSWVAGQPWLHGLLAVAEEEARERGDAVVYGHHVALALTRDEAAVDLLHRLGLQARRWRDYINFILGVNAGVRSHRERRLPVSQHRSPADVFHHGPTQPEPTALAVVEDARREGTAADQQVTAAHMLVALTNGSGGIGTGTAWWLGLGPAAVRDAAGLPPPQPTLSPVIAALPRPRARGALVLTGGGALPDQVLAVISELTAATSGHIRVAVVAAAAGSGAAVERRCAQVRAALPDVDVADAGLIDRHDAHSSQVLDRLAHADVVFLDGGDAERFYTALAGTPALNTLVAASDRGAVVVGYSAGTQVLGAGCRRGGWAEPRLVPLLGWLAGFVIVPHCSGTALINELRATMSAFPGTRGLGVAHSGAVLVPVGWRHIQSLALGNDDGSVVLDHPDAAPQLLHQRPYTYADDTGHPHCPEASQPTNHRKSAGTGTHEEGVVEVTRRACERPGKVPSPDPSGAA